MKSINGHDMKCEPNVKQRRHSCADAKTARKGQVVIIVRYRAVTSVDICRGVGPPLATV